MSEALEKTPENLRVVIADLALELQNLTAMEGTEGWKVLDAEMSAYIKDCFESLAVCGLDDVPKFQGKIAALTWVKGHVSRVSKELGLLETELKDMTTE